MSEISEAISDLPPGVLSDTHFIELHRNQVDCIREMLDKHPINLEQFNDYFSSSQRSAIFRTALSAKTKSVKLLALDAVTDLLVVFGYKQVAKWYDIVSDNFAAYNTPTKSCSNVSQLSDIYANNERAAISISLLEQLIRLTEAMDPVLAFRSAECLAQWLMSAGGDKPRTGLGAEGRRALRHLLMLLFYAPPASELLDPTPEQRVRRFTAKRQNPMLRTFFKLFASVSRRNQRTLRDVYLGTVDHLRMRAPDAPPVSVDIDGMRVFIEEVTAGNHLAKEAVEREVKDSIDPTQPTQQIPSSSYTDILVD